jgi:hypothetical protein
MSRSRDASLKRTLARTERLLAKGTKASTGLTRWRLTLFLVGLLCTVTLYKLGWYQRGNIVLTGFVAAFLAVAAYHSRLESRIHRLRLWNAIKAVHLARMRLDWAHIPPRSGEPLTSHLYANDLDLVGPHSLTHLIDTTVSDHGAHRLRTWLLNQPPPPAVWAARHALVKQLMPRALFRDRLVLEAQLAGEQEINGRRLAAVLEHPIGFPRLGLILAVQSVLALTTLILGLGALLNWLPGYWMFSFGLYAATYLMTDQGEELLEHAVGLHHEMERLGTVLAHLERHAKAAGSALAHTCQSLTEPGRAPSSFVRTLARILSGISVKAHPLVHLGLNALCPWDLLFTFRLRQIQRRIHTRLSAWLDCLAEVEAASALATFAYLHPAYVWPAAITSPAQGNGGNAALIARQLGHPLIPEQKRVTNDYALQGLGSVTLITGSNMSGKSTFLRTIGINFCLAQAGAPVCAGRFEWTWSRVACCIRVDDSLDAGLSFFYAEVKRLKIILEATRERQAPPVLFLIDEIFKGTNNRERLIGSRAYITALAQGNGYGLVSTHDLELADMEKRVPALSNAHFQEMVNAGALEFDYQLRPGPCPTTNALRIMELEGLPIADADANPHLDR